MIVKNEREKSKVSFGLLFFDKGESIDFLSSVCLFLSRRFSVRFVLFAFDDCFFALLSSSSLLRSHYVVVLALSREVLFRARALVEKKRISIDYRRLCGLLPEKKKKDDVINDASPFGCASNKKSLSSRKRTTTREQMITALSRTRRNFKDDYTFLF